LKLYGKLPGYIFFGFVVVPTLNPAETMAVMGPLLQEAVKCSYEMGAPKK
jgi:hypothetical protein